MENAIQKIENKLIKLLGSTNVKMRFYLCIYRITYDLVFVLVISKYFTYVGYKYEFDILKLIISWIFFIFILKDIVRVNNLASFSNVAVLLLDLGYAIPTLALYAFGGVTHNYFIFFSLYWIVLHMWNLLLDSIKIRDLYIKNSNYIYYFLIIVISFSILIISYKKLNFNNILLTDQVYILRDAYKNMNLSSITRYLISMSAVVLPIGINIALCKKRRSLVIYLTVAQFAIFLFGGIKKYLFALVLSYVFYYLFQKRKNVYLIIPELCFVNILAIVNYYLSNGMPQISNYIQRRTFMMPVRLSTYYFDYFTKHSPDFFSQSFMKYFGLESEYKMPIQNMIGGLYNGSYDNVASNGLCGDAISNMGYMSILVYPFLIAFVIRLLSYALKYAHASTLMLTAIIFFTYFTNGSFFSNLLSNGFILLFIIMLFYRNVKESKYV